MSLEYDARIRELVSLIASEDDAEKRKELARELESLLNAERNWLKSRLIEVPHRVLHLPTKP